VGGKFGTSAAVGVVLPPAPQMVEKQGWTYVSRSNQLVRGAHEPQTEITCVAFSQVGWGGGGGGGRLHRHSAPAGRGGVCPGVQTTTLWRDLHCIACPR
jgi:hypothetical protein